LVQQWDAVLVRDHQQLVVRLRRTILCAPQGRPIGQGLDAKQPISAALLAGLNRRLLHPFELAAPRLHDRSFGHERNQFVDVEFHAFLDQPAQTLRLRGGDGHPQHRSRRCLTPQFVDHLHDHLASRERSHLGQATPPVAIEDFDPFATAPAEHVAKVMRLLGGE
jgi:hypothetical protein